MSVDKSSLDPPSFRGALKRTGQGREKALWRGLGRNDQPDGGKSATGGALDAKGGSSQKVPATLGVCCYRLR